MCFIQLRDKENHIYLVQQVKINQYQEGKYLFPKGDKTHCYVLDPLETEHPSQGQQSIFFSPRKKGYYFSQPSYLFTCIFSLLSLAN